MSKSPASTAVPSTLPSTTKRSLSRLQVFIDLGSSLTKVLYVTAKGGTGWLVMPPAVAMGLGQDSLNEFLAVNQGLPPAEAAWIELAEDGATGATGANGAIAVGNLASGYQGQSALVQRKVMSGLYRVLAVLGVLREMLNLPPQFECDLGLALPVAEYTTRQTLEERLKANAQFSCRGVAVDIDFRLIDCQPEGYGLVRERRAEMVMSGTIPTGDKSKIVAVMMGHRNLSILVFAGSALQMNLCRSDGAGFVLAVETAARSIGVEPNVDGLLEAIATKKGKLRVQGAGMQPLDIRDAVQQGRAAYWSAVTQYLQTHLPGGDYGLIIGGGASWAMREELKTWVDANGLTASFCESIQQKIGSALRSAPVSETHPLSPEEELFSLQLADAFVGFSALITKIKKNYPGV